MERKFTKILLLALTFCCLAAVGAFAQTVVLGSIDPGPYGQGSTIAVPFHLNTTPGCASSGNVFNLYLSDAAGNFGAPKLIGNYAGFYGTFVNGTIPNATAASANYRVRIQCSDPAILPVTSGPITINASPGVTAGTSSQAINSSTPEVFGSCIGSDNTSYSFVNASSAGAVATATFFNELTQTTEDTRTFPTSQFIAKAANYTIVVRATSAGIVGTKAYSLINNPVNNSFGASGSNQVCLDGATKLTYSVDINSPNGIQKNYPGLVYSVTWGDGTSTNYTLCEIVTNGGTIDHTYKKASCGNVANGLQNVFQIDLQPTSPFCGKLGTPVTGYARVIEAPKNKIGYLQTACTNTPVVFANQSIPGQDPNSTTFDCTNLNALYTWVVDGVTVAVNYPLDKPLEYTFTTNGVHFVGLHLQNGNAICAVEDKIINICIQNPPKPSFILANSTICTSGPVTPVNTSVVDETCDANTVYNWRVTGPAQPNFLSGTSASSKTPTFNFTVAGLYTLTLDITTNSCGLVSSAPQEVVINLNPTAVLSANSLICGKDQTLTFGPSATITKTTLTGTAKELPATYVWDISGGAFSYENGTTANSQYPQVKFTEYKVYTIKVTHTNNCNVATATQVLTFQQSPDVNAGGDRTICEGNSTLMDATITGVYSSFRWVGGTGTFAPSRNVLKPTYTPSAAEITAGTATISLEVTTNLAAPCNIIANPTVIAITLKDNITSAAGAEVCTGSNFSYTITSLNPASTYNWTASILSGTASGFGATGSGNTINDVVNDTGTGDAIVRYIITPITNGCPGNPFTLDLTVNRIPVLTATPAAAPICSNQPTGLVLTSSQPGTTYTWASVADAGITNNTNQATPVAATTIPDLLNNTGTLYGVVKYTITPYHGACAGQPVTVTVTVAPAPIASVAGTDEHICAGPTYTLKGNNPSPGTGMWTLASGQTGITFSDATKPNAVVNGLQPGNVYQFTWTINTAAGCTPNTSTVTITVDVPTVGGTADGTVSVCADANHGFLNLTGNLGTVLSWESSTDGTNWITQLNTTNQYEYTNLTQTTQFRAVVQNGVCNIERSAIATVTVNQPVIAANGGAPLTTLCNAATYTLSGNDPTPFAGIWTQTAGPPATFVDATNPKTVVNGLIGGYTYKFTWTIKGTAPCGDSQNEITIVNNPDVLPKFISDFTNTVCGPVTVNFTNQSSPNFAGTTYLWDFGDGSGNTNDISPQHIFQPSPDGTDITYKVTLTIINNCVPHEPFPMNITVRPAAPVATILPDKLSECGSLAIRLKNTSPGTNQYYDFFVFDGKTQVLPTMRKSDKSDAVFAPLGPPKNDAFYTVYMVATDFCGNTTQSSPSIPITIYPATFVPLFFAKDNKTTGCFPLTVAFENISSGGQTFLYRIYDAAVGGNKVDEIQGSKTEQPYTFNAPGTYYVSVVAINDCATFESTNRIKFEAYPTPAPNFTADVTSGCKALRVTFANTTLANGATPPQSLTYEWDFGDGSAHFFGYTPIPHVYSPKNSPYTVTLKVTNVATGCTDVITKPGLIQVTAAPNVDFAANPGFVTKIPNYHFAFDDKTSGNPNPVAWNWDFGDGNTSTQQNPGHTYADTGTYKVTLRVVNRDGCDSTVTHNVQITGIPGQLYIPNAFMPAGSTSELRTFVMKGSGIESWRFQVFNNWGQLVWETTKLSSTGEPVETWDGTYKGAPAQQGVYVWQASAHFINGTDWKGMQYGSNTLPKRTGVIHLIR